MVKKYTRPLDERPERTAAGVARGGAGDTETWDVAAEGRKEQESSKTGRGRGGRRRGAAAHGRAEPGAGRPEAGEKGRAEALRPRAPLGGRAGRRAPRLPGPQAAEVGATGRAGGPPPAGTPGSRGRSYMTQHFVLCAWGSLKRSLCLGRYFSRYMSCLLLMAPRRFLQRQGMGSGSGGPRAGPPALPPRARRPRVWWGRSGWVLTATRALPTPAPRPLPELLPPPGSPILVTCCQPCWPSVHPTTASSRLAPRSPRTRGPMLPRPPCLPGAPRHAEATGKAWAYMLSGGDLGQQVGGLPRAARQALLEVTCSHSPTTPGHGLALANEM